MNTAMLQTRNCAVLSSREAEYIVMHYTGNSKDTAAANAKYFADNDLEASAHYFVDDGTIYQSVAAKDRAWHCGASRYYHAECRNQNSIGIEMCCTAGNYTISDATKHNAAMLCAELCRYLGIEDVDRYVLRHYDVTHKSCPRQMVTDGAQWTAFKAEVRNLLKGAEDMTKEELKEANVKVGSKTVKGFEVNDTIYVPVRAFVETMKEELTVNWSFQDGASVTL